MQAMQVNTTSHCSNWRACAAGLTDVEILEAKDESTSFRMQIILLVMSEIGANL